MEVTKINRRVRDIRRLLLQKRAQELGVGFVNLDHISIDRTAIVTVLEETAKRHRVIPVKKEGTVLYLAMEDTRSEAALADVRSQCSFRIIPILATGDEIDAAIHRYYDDEQFGTIVLELPLKPEDPKN